MIRTSIPDSGKDRALRDRLVVEVYVAGVEDRPAFRAQHHSRRAEHVAGIDKIRKSARRQCRGRGALAVQRERLAQRAMTASDPSRDLFPCG